MKDEIKFGDVARRLPARRCPPALSGTTASDGKNRAHTGSMEIRAIWSYIDLTSRSNSVTWCAPNAFVDAAMYERGQVRRVGGLGRAWADRAHGTACGAERLGRDMLGPGCRIMTGTARRGQDNFPAVCSD
jgi:hypothetical protein